MAERGLRPMYRGEGRKVCTRQHYKPVNAIAWCPACGVAMCEQHFDEDSVGARCPHNDLRTERQTA